MDIARKYARAYFQVYGDTINRELIHNIEKTIQFLRAHRRVLFLLKVPVIDHAVKVEGIGYLCDRFSLGDPIKKLLLLLLNARRIEKYIPMFRAVIEQYQRKNHEMTVTVSSSMPLSDEQRTALERFLSHRVAGNLHYMYTVDVALIAGVRVLSNTFLWEFSVAKQLRDMYHAAIW